MPQIPEGAKKPSDRLKAESAAEGEFTAEFKGVELRVLPFLDWDKDAVSHINNLNLSLWAEGALHPDDVKKFASVKASLREALAFIKDAAAQGGGDLGEFLAS
jgi:hypothetical protein